MELDDDQRAAVRLPEDVDGEEDDEDLIDRVDEELSKQLSVSQYLSRVLEDNMLVLMELLSPIELLPIDKSLRMLALRSHRGPF